MNNESIETDLADVDSPEPGFRCERMKGKTITEEDWRALHKEHGEPEKVYNEAQPSAYRLYRLVCPCEKVLQCMEELPGVD